MNTSEQSGKDPVIIIGAGPAGLAAAALLRQADIPFVVLEKGKGVAQCWRDHYDRLHLHTVRDLSHLPGLPFPEDYPQYVPKQELVAYYEHYAQHFGIEPLTQHEVSDLTRLEDGRWQVDCSNGATFVGPQIILCAGMNRMPFRPHFQNEEEYEGAILHSHDYQNATPYRDKEVLVVGMGNSGAEIALDLCEHQVSTAISVRGPVNIVPKEVLGRPTQVTALKIAKLPHWLGDRLGLLVRKFTVGDLPKYGIELPAISPARQLRETGQTPVIDLGTLDYIRAGELEVMPAIEHFTKTGVLFTNGEERNYDAVVLATGFRAQLNDWLPLQAEYFDERGLPKSPVGQGAFAGLFFLGYNNYAPGGGLGIIRTDAPKVVRAIQASRN
jgi:cation diffusion facilitator CzcD-associated flavoprotein CzcO